MKLTQTETEQSASDIAGGKTQDVENPEVQDPQVPAASTPMVPTLKLVPFVQKKGNKSLISKLYIMIGQRRE